MVYFFKIYIGSKNNVRVKRWLVSILPNFPFPGLYNYLTFLLLHFPYSYLIHSKILISCLHPFQFIHIRQMLRSSLFYPQCSGGFVRRSALLQSGLALSLAWWASRHLPLGDPGHPLYLCCLVWDLWCYPRDPPDSSSWNLFPGASVFSVLRPPPHSGGSPPSMSGKNL